MLKHTKTQKGRKAVARLAVEPRTHDLIKWCADEINSEISKLVWDMAKVWCKTKGFDPDKILGGRNERVA